MNSAVDNSVAVENPSASTDFNRFQQAGANPPNRKQLKVGYSCPAQETALGAGGRQFESARPDQ